MEHFRAPVKNDVDPHGAVVALRYGPPMDHRLKSGDNPPRADLNMKTQMEFHAWRDTFIGTEGPDR